MPSRFIRKVHHGTAAQQPSPARNIINTNNGGEGGGGGGGGGNDEKCPSPLSAFTAFGGTGGNISPETSALGVSTRPMHLNGSQRRRSMAFAALSSPSPPRRRRDVVGDDTSDDGEGDGASARGDKGSSTARRTVSVSPLPTAHDLPTLSVTTPPPEDSVGGGGAMGGAKANAVIHNTAHASSRRRVSITTRGINVTLEGATAAATGSSGELPRKRTNTAAAGHCSPSPSPSMHASPPPPSSSSSAAVAAAEVAPSPHAPATTAAAFPARRRMQQRALAASPTSSLAVGGSGNNNGAGGALSAALSDQLSPELLGLVRAFRQAVERAIVENEMEEDDDTMAMAGGRNGGGLSSASHAITTTNGGGAGSSSSNHVHHHHAAPSSSLAIPRYVGAELNQACNDVIRYVTQYVKHKRDEFEELLVRHVRWGQPMHGATTEEEMAVAEREGPHYLTSLYGVLESLIASAGCDRAILYMINPAARKLVGIAYGGTTVPIQVPLQVPIAVQVEPSRTGGLDKHTIHPAAVAMLSHVGINIASLQDCPPELKVEAYDHLSGYSTRNTLCVPVVDVMGMGMVGGARVAPLNPSTTKNRNGTGRADSVGSDLSTAAHDVGGKRRKSVAMMALLSERAAASGSGASPSRRGLFDDSDGDGDSDADDASNAFISEPRVPVIGVIQLINKHRTAPLRGGGGGVGTSSSGSKAMPSSSPPPPHASSSSPRRANQSLPRGGVDGADDDDQEEGHGSSSSTMAFTARDELSAAHAAEQIATIMGWATLSRVDFLSTSALRLSAQLQHMHAGIRQRAREHKGITNQKLRADGVGAAADGARPTCASTCTSPSPSTKASASAKLRSSGAAGGSVHLTHSGDAIMRAKQAQMAVSRRQEARDGICGDVIDAVEATVIKAGAEAMLYGARREAEAGEETEEKDGGAGVRAGGSAGVQQQKRRGVSIPKASSSSSPSASASRHHHHNGSSSSASPSTVIADDRRRLAAHTATVAATIRSLTDQVFGGGGGGGSGSATAQSSPFSAGRGGGNAPGQPSLLHTRPLLVHRIVDRHPINLTALGESGAVSGLMGSALADTAPSNTSKGGGSGSRNSTAFIDGVVGGYAATAALFSPTNPPTIIEATQAYTHLKGAWKHVHAQLMAVTDRLGVVQSQLDRERARCNALEVLCRRHGISTAAASVSGASPPVGERGHHHNHGNVPSSPPSPTASSAWGGQGAASPQHRHGSDDRTSPLGVGGDDGSSGRDNTTTREASFSTTASSAPFASYSQSTAAGGSVGGPLGVSDHSTNHTSSGSGSGSRDGRDIARSLGVGLIPKHSSRHQPSGAGGGSSSGMGLVMMGAGGSDHRHHHCGDGDGPSANDVAFMEAAAAVIGEDGMAEGVARSRQALGAVAAPPRLAVKRISSTSARGQQTATCGAATARNLSSSSTARGSSTPSASTAIGKGGAAVGGGGGRGGAHSASPHGSSLSGFFSRMSAAAVATSPPSSAR